MKRTALALLFFLSCTVLEAQTFINSRGFLVDNSLALVTVPSSSFQSPTRLNQAGLLVDASGAVVISALSPSGGGVGGSVVSVDATVPSWLAVSGVPILTSGTIAITAASAQTSHKVIGTGAGSTFGPVTLGTLDLPFTYSGNTVVLATTTGVLTAGHTLAIDASGNLIDGGVAPSSGTVTSVTFTGDGVVMSATPSAAVTTSGTVTAALATAAAHKVLGNFTGATAAPTYGSLTTAELPFTFSGNTTKLVTTTGALTNGNCVSIDASGNFVDSGGLCGGGGGGGSVTSVGLVLPSAFTVTNSPIVGAGNLTGTWNVAAANSVITSTAANTAAWGLINAGSSCGDSTHAISFSSTTHLFGCQAISQSVTFTGGLISASTLALTVAGTSGGFPYFSSGTTWASTGVMAAGLPIIGGGAGVSPTTGTVSGNSTKFVTTTGTLTNGHCVSIDANGNFVDSGSLGCASATPAGPVSHLQFNTAGSFGATDISYAANVYTPDSDNVTSLGSATLAFANVFTHALRIVPTGPLLFDGLGSNSCGTPTTNHYFFYLGDDTSKSVQISENNDTCRSVALWKTTTPTQLGLVFASSSVSPGGTVPHLDAGTAIKVDASGSFISTYNATATSGNGIPALLYASDVPARTSSIGATTMFTTPASGAYATGIFVVYADIVCTTGQATTTVGLTLSWNNGSASQTSVLIPTSSSCTTTGNEYSSVSFPIYSAASQAISFTTTAANFTTGAYQARIRLESK